MLLHTTAPTPEMTKTTFATKSGFGRRGPTNTESAETITPAGSKYNLVPADRCRVTPSGLPEAPKTAPCYTSGAG